MSEINSFAVVDRYIDVGRRRIADANLAATFTTENALYVKDKVIVRARLRLSNNEAFVVPAGATFYWCIDNSYTEGHTDLASSATALFNLASDWAEIDFNQGQICWRANLNTTALKTALSTSEYVDMTEELWMLVPGGEYSLIYASTVRVKNIVGDITETPVTPGVEYATLDALNAIAPTGFRIERAGDVVRFLIDGIVVQTLTKPE